MTVRNTKREDVFRFLIPGFPVLCPALAVSVWDFSTKRGSTLVLVPQGNAGSLRIEERMLIEEFGVEYRTYRKTASKLIPYIY